MQWGSPSRSVVFRWFALTALLLSGVVVSAASGEEPADFRHAAGAWSVAPEAIRDGRLVQRQPAGAFGGDVYLVAWCDGSRQVDRPTADIYCARVEAATGKSLGSAKK